MLRYEEEAWSHGHLRVAGTDEAGRGPLAGPVAAAAVLFDPAFLRREAQGLLAGLTDSKKLSEDARERFFALLHSHQPATIAIGVGLASVGEIDRLNILRASHLAMERAIAQLPQPLGLVLVDGLPIRDFPYLHRGIVKGDSLSLSIAAASIVAKVTRDRLMRELDALHPAYGFAIHKGYGTRRHLQALREHGPCPEHRRSFRPVAELLNTAEGKYAF